VHFGISVPEQVKILNDPGFRLGHSGRQLNRNVEQFISTWSRHVASWLDAREFPLLLVRYEDMLTDTEKELERVVRFAGFPVEAEVIAKAVAASTFDALAAQEKTDGFREFLQRPSASFFRRGVAGGWRDSLPAELAASIVREHGAMMQRLGYET
jgi:aryl sulfotransferase